MSLNAPECVWNVAAELGEGPLWHAADRALYFTDIKGHKVHRLEVDSGTHTTWTAPAQIGFILPLTSGRFVCGAPGRLLEFSPDTGGFTPLLMLDEPQHNRLNDGYVDASGRLWFGSMDDAEVQSSGSLYRVDADGTLTVADTDYVITNGPAMSPDSTTLYHTDTLKQQVYAFPVSADGTLGNKRIFASIEQGYPDGMAVDSEGFVWIALFAGGRIERRSPGGECVATVDFPCSNVTKLAFGGDDLRTVYATTAWKGLSAAQRDAQPLAGRLFSFRVDTPGLPQNECSLTQ